MLLMTRAFLYSIDTGILYVHPIHPISGLTDTLKGIDYRNPALGGGIEPGFKIVGGYDFAGDNYNGKDLKDL